MTVAIVLAELLPAAIRPWVQAGIWAAALYAVLTQPAVISNLSDEDARFIELYDDVLKQVATLRSRASSMDAAEYISEFVGLIDALEALKPPSPRLAELKSATVEELRRRLVMMKLEHWPSPDEMEAADQRWSAIEREFHSIVRPRRTFR